MLDKAKKYYSKVEGLNVAILGITFKLCTDDIREWTAIKNINTLLKNKTSIKVYDSISIKRLKEIYKDKIKFANNISEELKDANICFIFTEWQQIKEMNLKLFEESMKKPIILDGRNCFKLEEIKKYNVSYESMGRMAVNNLKK